MAAAFAPAAASWPRKARLEEAAPQLERAAPRRAAPPAELRPDRPQMQERAAPTAASVKTRPPSRPCRRTDPCQTRPTRGARRRRRASGASEAPRAARAPWPALSRPARPARPELAVPQAAREPARAARPVLLVARPAPGEASAAQSASVARLASLAAAVERRAGQGPGRRGRRPSSRQHRPRRRGSPRACRPWRAQPCTRPSPTARAAGPRRPASGTARSRTGPLPGLLEAPLAVARAAQRAAARRVVARRAAALAARARRLDRAQRTPAPPRLRAAGFPSCRQTDRRR